VPSSVSSSGAQGRSSAAARMAGVSVCRIPLESSGRLPAVDLGTPSARLHFQTSYREPYPLT